MRGRLALAAAGLTLITLSGSCSNNAQNIDHRHPLPVHCRRQVGATCIGATPGPELVAYDMSRPEGPEMRNGRPGHPFAAGVNCFKGRYARNAAKPGDDCFKGYLYLEVEEDGQVNRKWRLAYRFQKINKTWHAVVEDNPPKSEGWFRMILVGYPVPPNVDLKHPHGWPFEHNPLYNDSIAGCDPNSKSGCYAVVLLQRMPSGHDENSCINNLLFADGRPTVFGACGETGQGHFDTRDTYLVYRPGSELIEVSTTDGKAGPLIPEGDIWCPVATHLTDSSFVFNLNPVRKHQAEWHLTTRRLP